MFALPPPLAQPCGSSKEEGKKKKVGVEILVGRKIVANSRQWANQSKDPLR